MATTQTINSNYAGEAAGEIIGKTFNEAETVSRGLVTFLPNVRYKLSLRKIQYTNGKTNYSCGFTPAGAIVLSEKELVIKDIKNDFEVCKNTFKATWGGLDDEMLDAVQVEVLSDTAEALDTEIWTGNAATAGEIGGLIPQFIADADIIKANNGIVPAAAAITKANVMAELEKVTSAFPVAVRKKKDFKVVVSSNVADAYDKALIAGSVSAGRGGASLESVYGKYTLSEVSTLPDNTIVAYQASNVVVASSKSNPLNEISLVDEDSIGLLTGQFRGKLVYGGSTGYYNSAEIVYYLSTTAVV